MPDTDAPIETHDAVIGVDGMSCRGCARRVEQAVCCVSGVTEARVDLAARTASVRYDPRRVELDDILGAIAAAGYRASRRDGAAEGARS